MYPTEYIDVNSHSVDALHAKTIPAVSTFKVKSTSSTILNSSNLIVWPAKTAGTIEYTRTILIIAAIKVIASLAFSFI